MMQREEERKSGSSVQRCFWLISHHQQNIPSISSSLHYSHGYIYIPWHRRERNRGYALLMKANKPETALYRAPTFSLLLASHGGFSLCDCQEREIEDMLC